MKNREGGFCEKVLEADLVSIDTGANRVLDRPEQPEPAWPILLY